MAKAATGSAKTERSGKMLVIVESPAKAKTINKYLGSAYEVKASMGHVRDLPSKGIGVDIDNRFTPTYEILDSRKKLINDLKASARKSSEVFLATDLDREGEAIAWHLAAALGLKAGQTKRVVFNEITKSAILSAFEHPRVIDEGKVNAQQARRILDRLVGYKVSPLLWKKVARGLSAGRVQSVAVRLVVEREKAIMAFVPEEYWKLAGVFTTDLQVAPRLAAEWEHFITGDEEDAADDGTDSAVTGPTNAEKVNWMRDNHAFRGDLIELNGVKFDPKNAADAQAAAEAVGLRGVHVETVENDGSNGPKGIPVKGPAQRISRVIGQVVHGPDAPTFTVRDLNSKQSTSRPSGPFSTSTLQQAASNQLSYGAQRTMRLAQQLYEGVELGEQGAVGLITYMRTDSLNISQDALTMVRSYIDEKFGEKYLPEKPNFYASRAGAQEAHEAIRPTDVALEPERIRNYLSEEQYKLYRLIWNRFVACQMMPARWLVTEALIESRRSAPEAPVALFKASGRTLQFDGFMRVTGVQTRSDEQVLPQLEPRQKVAPIDLTPTQHFTSPPPRYSEASLVKALEAEGIGRPSTYASIINTIQERHYVESRERRMFATALGIKVTEKLIEGFPDLMDLGFTRRIEGELDQVEDTQRDWVAVVHDFYDPLAKALETAEERMTHARAEAEPSEYKCPDCGAPMEYRLSKRGKRFLSCSRYPECKAAISVDREGKPVQQEITEHKCPVCGKPLIKRMGRFGPFLGCSGYPECKTIVNLDKKTGEPLPPKPPPEDTGLKCPKCGKKNLLVRVGKRGPFISCGGYPKCRMTLPAERLEEFKQLAAEGKWPPEDVITKAGGVAAAASKAGAAGGDAKETKAAPARKAKTAAKKKPAARKKTAARKKPVVSEVSPQEVSD